MSEEVDEFLAHYGVVGMKWGKRKGGLGDRVKGAALDSIQRRRTTNDAIAKGNGKARDFTRVASRRLAGVPTVGSKKIAAKRVASLDASAERIKSGKVKARDVIDFLGNTSVADLVVSRRDTRG